MKDKDYGDLIARVLEMAIIATVVMTVVMML